MSAEQERLSGAGAETSAPAPYVKQRADAPAGFFTAEADGLRWLAEPQAAAVVGVIDVGQDSLVLERIAAAPPTPEHARRFGAQLARLHDAGADTFGWFPSSSAWFGPLDQPFEVTSPPRQRFADFWAKDRLRPIADQIAHQIDPASRRAIDDAITVIAQGAFDGIAGQGREAPSRVHGDLWSGNLMWTASGCVLIDPAAHGGHRLEDLALLSLFGAPHLEEIFAGYETEHAMPADWREDLPAHLFFALLAHVHLFGQTYMPGAVRTAERILARARALGA